MAGDSGITDDRSPSGAGGAAPANPGGGAAGTAGAAAGAGARPAPLAGPLRLMDRIGLTPFTLGLIVILAGAFIAYRIMQPPALAFDDAAFQNIGNVLAPLVLVAGFIERAVEVILTPMRGDASDHKRKEAARARAEGREPDPDELEAKAHEHRLGNRRRAFLLAVAMGVLASLLGVRGLESLLAQSAEPGAGFQFFDIAVTGLVVGGGADGIHQIVEAFTGYMEKISRETEAA